MAVFEQKMEEVKRQLRLVKPELIKWHSEVENLLSTTSQVGDADDVRARKLDSLYARANELCKDKMQVARQDLQKCLIEVDRQPLDVRSGYRAAFEVNLADSEPQTKKMALMAAITRSRNQLAWLRADSAAQLLVLALSMRAHSAQTQLKVADLERCARTPRIVTPCQLPTTRFRLTLVLETLAGTLVTALVSSSAPWRI